MNLKKAAVGQPKYCNNAYFHVVLTNLCSTFSICKIRLTYGCFRFGWAKLQGACIAKFPETLYRAMPNVRLFPSSDVQRKQPGSDKAARESSLLQIPNSGFRVQRGTGIPALY